MDRISICGVSAKRNEINSFLKWMVTEDEKWVTYDNTVRKQSWSKRGEAAQTVNQTRTKSQKGSIGYLVGLERIIYYEFLPYCQTLNSDI
ncbi:mariner transposase [Trichonephila clavipes]|nr:mariner transposase [Trichonephila clavipes]